MTIVSEKTVINITSALSCKGETFCFKSEIFLPDELLSYPSARFTKAYADLRYASEDGKVNVEGEIVCSVSGQCDRCCDFAENTYVVPFAQTFFQNGGEEGEYTYEGCLLDVTKAVWDEIVLSLPTVFLCSENCRGLCARCGANLNRETCGCDVTRDNAFSVLKNLKF